MKPRPQPFRGIPEVNENATVLRRALALAVAVAALGYFVDIYDLVLFSILRVPSLRALGVTDGRDHHPRARCCSTCSSRG